MLDRMDSTSNAHSIEPAPGTGDESRDRAELRCTRSSRSRTGEAHRTRTAQVQAGHTAAAQRSARNEARPCIYLRRSGGSRAVRSYTPAPAAPAWDATQAQCSHHAARTNPALASVSGASRRSRAAPGRRSLIVAAIASAAVAIAVTPPLGTVLVAHAGSVRGGRAELAGTAGPRRHRHRHCCHRSKRHVLRRRWWRWRGRRSRRRQRWRGRRPPPNSNHTLSRSHRE